MGKSNTAPVAENIIFLPEARIMWHRPQTPNEAKTILTLNYTNIPNSYLPINPLAQKERSRILRRLVMSGDVPAPKTYNLFHITHDGTLVDFKLKCLLVMGMCLSAQAEGDVTADKIRPYLRNFAAAYMEHELPTAGADDPMAIAPRQVRIAKAS